MEEVAGYGSCYNFDGGDSHSVRHGTYASSNICRFT